MLCENKVENEREMHRIKKWMMYVNQSWLLALYGYYTDVIDKAYYSIFIFER